MNKPDHADRKERGPIPPGRYEIDPEKLSDPGLIGDIARQVHGDWGDWRVPLQPKPETRNPEPVPMGVQVFLFTGAVN